jgi:peptide/nickel transport system permease protein
MRTVMRRLGFYGLAAWAALTINFVLPRLMPGDPATALFARFKGQLAPDAVSALRTAFGLTDEPLALQYLTYLGHVFRGDLGVSVAYFPSRVSDVIWGALGWTALVAGTALLVSFCLGSLLGIAAAWWRNGWLDRFVTPALAWVGAFPYFWLAMASLYWLGFVKGWVPLGHAYSDELEPGFNWAFLVDVVRHAALPVGTMVVATVGQWMLGMRNSMMVVMGSDFVTLARAKGLSEARIVFRYAARNALLPNLTGFGMALGFMLGGSLLTELVFSYPGEGYLLVQAVRGQDYPLMQGIFLVITAAVLVANWLLDVVIVWLDPRTQERIS